MMSALICHAEDDIVKVKDSSIPPQLRPRAEYWDARNTNGLVMRIVDNDEYYDPAQISQPFDRRLYLAGISPRHPEKVVAGCISTSISQSAGLLRYDQALGVAEYLTSRRHRMRNSWIISHLVRYRTLSTMAGKTPILPCHDFDSITTSSSAGPSHALQSPIYTINESLRPHIEAASDHLRAGRTVAVPTETVYGLAANSLNPSAVQRIYAIKNRPADNPLIIHVSSLNMLSRLLPPASTYTHSKLYMALITAFWPGPLTLLFPSANPPPLPAPQTNAIRMPAHPLTLALISHSDLPLSAPSANSSGRPSPTRAQHVANDLDGAEGLGCILDGGDCGVGVESTVVDGLSWKEGGGGSVNVLRPGGLGVEDIARVVGETDGAAGRTRILVHGREWSRNAVAGPSRQTLPPRTPLNRVNDSMPNGLENYDTANPSTPGMKYRHYSPRIPVHLLLPSYAFPRPSLSPSSDPGPSEPSSAKEIGRNTNVEAVLRSLAQRYTTNGHKPHFGTLHFENSPLHLALESAARKNPGMRLSFMSLGPDTESAARRLFSGMLDFEGDQAALGKVDAILIEGCKDEGLGLAVMERVSKAVGGGGISGGLTSGQVTACHGDDGRFWVDV